MIAQQLSHWHGHFGSPQQRTENRNSERHHGSQRRDRYKAVLWPPPSQRAPEGALVFEKKNECEARIEQCISNELAGQQLERLMRSTDVQRQQSELDEQGSADQT